LKLYRPCGPCTRCPLQIGLFYQRPRDYPARISPWHIGGFGHVDGPIQLFALHITAVQEAISRMVSSCILMYSKTYARRRSPRPRNDITHKPKPSHADRSGVSKANRSRGQEAETETRERRQTPSEQIALKGWRVSNLLVLVACETRGLVDGSRFHSSCSFDGVVRSGGGMGVTGSRMP
jgi:hypothetical protein